jgi:hypothetical protein
VILPLWDWRARLATDPVSLPVYFRFWPVPLLVGDKGGMVAGSSFPDSVGAPGSTLERVDLSIRVVEGDRGSIRDWAALPDCVWDFERRADRRRPLESTSVFDLCGIVRVAGVGFAVLAHADFLGVDCDSLERVEAREMWEMWDVDDELIADVDGSSVEVVLLSFEDVV